MRWHTNPQADRRPANPMPNCLSLAINSLPYPFSFAHIVLCLLSKFKSRIFTFTKMGVFGMIDEQTSLIQHIYVDIYVKISKWIKKCHIWQSSKSLKLGSILCTHLPPPQCHWPPPTNNAIHLFRPSRHIAYFGKMNSCCDRLWFHFKQKMVYAFNDSAKQQCWHFRIAQVKNRWDCIGSWCKILLYRHGE